MAKYILLLFLVVLIESVYCGKLVQCGKSKLKKITGIFLHFLDEFVIFQVEFVGISVVFIILVSVNVAMKHLMKNKHTIAVFQRIQHVQRMVEM